MEDIAITNARVYAPHLPQGFYENGFITISAGRIRSVGLMPEFDAPDEAWIIDAEGGLVMPGLVNCHNHAGMTLFRGLADDLPLMTWLEKHIFPAEARFVNPEMVYWATKLAAAEMILSGTTTVADAYFFEDESARAFTEAGMRAVAAQGVIDFPAPGVPDPKENVAVAERYLERWQENERVRPAVFAHSPYTCSSKTLVAAKEAARRHNALFFIHLSETAGERDLLGEKWSGSPASYLHSLNILDEQTVCVHSVWLDEKDIDLVAESGAQVVSCPESNMKLASGIAPLAELRLAGVNVGLGTDGCASNNDLDLFGEMDACAKLHKVHRLDPTIMKARDVLRMATEDGARLLGMKDVGLIAPDMRADLIILDLNKPHLTPFYSIDNLVYAACSADVVTSIIDGKIVMDDREILTFDVAETMDRVAEMACSVMKE
ncbi:MAG: amidohydrolase [Desulfobulbaceae bacterium]|nr:amidohydrolase [Desulfobulbaceae bacterium]